jgi:hypothetical protein
MRMTRSELMSFRLSHLPVPAMFRLTLDGRDGLVKFDYVLK